MRVGSIVRAWRAIKCGGWPLKLIVRWPVRVLRNIAATVCMSFAVLVGTEYIRPLYSRVVVDLLGSPGWTGPMFTAVWGFELATWAITAVVLGVLLRSTHWYVWTLGTGAFGTFMAWPQYVVTIGSHSASHEPTTPMYAYAFLPLIGAIIGTTMLYLVRVLRRPPNQRLERP